MLAFFTRRIRQWLILAIAVPLITLVVRTVRKRIEAKSGPNKVTEVLGKVEEFGDRKKRSARAR
ncbi:MAG TPA: hypothetical protein VIT20_10150 [Propionibacteriaceae bacterium]